MIQRRAFLTGLASALAAPGIALAMPVQPTMTAIEVVNRALLRAAQPTGPLLPAGAWKVQWGNYSVSRDPFYNYWCIDGSCRA